MNTPSYRALSYKTTRLCLQSIATLLLLATNIAAYSEDEAIHDNKETLIPSVSPGKKIDTSQASIQGVLGEVLIWQLRAGEIYGGGENTYKIPVLEEQENEMSRVGGWQRRNIYIPTHAYLEAGDEITLDVKNYPSLLTRCSAYTFANFDKPYGPDATNSMGLKQNTQQVYKATIPGMLMLACVDQGKNMNNWNSWGTTVTISTSPPPKKTSLYVYGATPSGDWPSLARSPDPSGQVYLFNGRTVMNFPAAVALAHADQNIDAMMREHLIITTRYDQLNGFSWQTERPLDTLALSMYQASFNICCMSHYYNGLIGINFGGDRVNSHWGDWHEYGHQNQLSWKWGHLTEISNNLFSLEACRMLTGNNLSDFSRCHPNLSFITPDPEAVGTFLKMDGIPEIPPDVPSNRTLLMLAQLYTSFPDWHAQLARDFRVAYARGDNSEDFSTDQKKMDWFALNSSRIVGRDLRGFFDKWEFTYSATARQAIADLNLPAPIKPSVQYSSEWTISTNHTLEGTIPVPLLRNTIGLVAYGKEEGPTLLQSVEDESYTKLTTLVVGTKRVPYPVVLRGTLKHGECPGEGPMHDISTCAGIDHNVYWKLHYEPLDNLLPLPDDNYEGVLRLGIRAAYDQSWGGTLTVPIKLNISKSQ
ncbi:M60 family metallopeptidase [Pseudomonas cichorii]|uniref:M60 family metallopeptidase n=1 Tax=Pseudomonas cichorii TaxID=36746 RepID=UPI001C8AD71C|nr:M60 family metallopeptidase [Pseudomonas cichorii]MBX8532284.1 M60 family metallopeptidase [Pseudomonas cichorii]